MSASLNCIYMYYCTYSYNYYYVCYIAYTFILKCSYSYAVKDTMLTIIDYFHFKTH